MSEKEQKNKLNATKVEINGITFHSKFEGETYEALLNIERSGLISNLALQHEVILIPGFTYDGRSVRPTKMIVDFHFDLNLPNGKVVDIDFETKGYQTDVYRIKIKLLKFLRRELSKADVYKYVLYRGRYLDSVYDQEMKIRDRLEGVIKNIV